MKLVIFVALISTNALAAEPSQNHVEGFRYTKCAKQTCVQVAAPEAWISLVSGGFTTADQASLKILDETGETKKAFAGTRAVFNADLGVITLDTKGGGFLLYSMRDGQITSFEIPEVKAKR